MLSLPQECSFQVRLSSFAISNRQTQLQCGYLQVLDLLLLYLIPSLPLFDALYSTFRLHGFPRHFILHALSLSSIHLQIVYTTLFSMLCPTCRGHGHFRSSSDIPPPRCVNDASKRVSATSTKATGESRFTSTTSEDLKVLQNMFQEAESHDLTSDLPVEENQPKKHRSLWASLIHKIRKLWSNPKTQAAEQPEALNSNFGLGKDTIRKTLLDERPSNQGGYGSDACELNDEDQDATETSAMLSFSDPFIKGSKLRRPELRSSNFLSSTQTRSR
jgi:hypothetical protein